MADEMIVRPLSGEEVQEAVIHKIRESMRKTCHLRPDDAYTSFRAKIFIHLVLSDYGREVLDNHSVEVTEFTGMADEPEAKREYEANITIEPAPPNQVRIETQQKVPIQVTEEGKKIMKFVRYAPRKAKGTPAPETPPSE